MQRSIPAVAAYGLALVVALALACDLLWMPIQVADSLGEMLDARRSPSAWASFTGNFGTEAYLRPFRIAQIKALFDLAQGSQYWLVYRGFHAALAVAALLLFTRALRVTAAADVAAAAFALAVLTGLHTFQGTVREAFPINHFLEVAVFCLLTLNLARSRGGAWVDAAALLSLLAAALTIESGVLVWVVAASAWAVGWRGISRRGLAMMTILLAAYLFLRFGYLSTGVPALSERSSGYLLRLLDPPELQARFGSQPLWFYTYNVAASAASVLFSEPRAGVFEAVRGWLEARPLPRSIIPVSTSIVTTGMIAWALLGRPVSWRVLDDTKRLILVGVAVLGANAVLSFAYTKDEIVSTAGVFYALAAFAAVRAMLSAPRTGGAVQVLLALVLCALSAGWAVRSVGLHYVLRSQALKHQIDWVTLPYDWRRNQEWPSDPADERLILQLRSEAVRVALPNTRAERPEWPAHVWTE